MFEHRGIMMRVNRLLGANLVEHNLVTMEDLEAANERYLEAMAAGSDRPPHLLSVLLYEKQTLREEALLHLLTEDMGLGLVDPRLFDIPESIKLALDPDLCWATGTVPFDKEEDSIFLATTYYLSPPVRDFWAKEYGDKIIWFATTQDAFTETLDAITKELASKPRAAVAAARP